MTGTQFEAGAQQIHCELGITITAARIAFARALAVSGMQSKVATAPSPPAVTEEEITGALDAYNRVWKEAGEIDSTNVESVRKTAIRAVLALIDAKDKENTRLRSISEEEIARTICCPRRCQSSTEYACRLRQDTHRIQIEAVLALLTAPNGG